MSIGPGGCPQPSLLGLLAFTIGFILWPTAVVMGVIYLIFSLIGA